MTGILEGLKVIDMGHFVAIPSAGAILADWGADVLKIEPLDGDAQRGVRNLLLKLTGSEVNWRFEVHNRNKKSLTLNLKKEAGRGVLCKLLEKADVFMSNYEAGTLTQLGVDYASLSRHNPKLVYALVTGYGTVGPDRDERGFDFAAAWARSGIQHMIQQPGSDPPQQRGGMMDRTVGAHVVAGVLAALLDREKTGKGHEIEFSLFHSGVWTLAADLQVALGGVPLTRNDRTKATNPLWNCYRTKDDRWLQLAMLQADLSWSDLCRAMEMPELENDPRFSNIEVRADNREELIRILSDTFASRTRGEWEKRLRENNCIYGRVQTPEEVIADPQAIANGFFTEVEHPVAGEVRYVASPVRFKQKPASVRTASPEIGQHTEEALLELGYSWDDIVRLKEQEVIL